MKKIAVYCGASTGNQPVYQEATRALGKWMCQNQYDLVYGGGNVGLMGTIADEVLARGGKAYGVIPTFLQEREIAHAHLTELHVVSTMHERKAKMMELADVYLALPGGPGTLEEISEVISWGRVGEHQNPCIFYNCGGYYNRLAMFFDHMVAEGFLSESDRKKIFFSDSLQEIQEFITKYQAPEIRKYR